MTLSRLKSWCCMILWLALAARLGISESLTCPARCYCLGTMVDCSKQSLKEVPDDLPSWMETLDLQGNTLSVVSPAAFQNLVNLQRLDLSNNRIQHLSARIFQPLVNLTELKLNQNRLSELPDFGSLPNLSLLSVSHNELTSLKGPWSKSLRLLDLSFNKIAEFPAGVFQNGSRLQILNLSSNRLHVLEKNCLHNLTALTELRLSRNRLANLPKETFKRLSALKTLELNRNSLTAVEGLTFEGLTSLTALRLRRNDITQLFDGAFYGLTAIQHLQLDFNSISRVTKGWLYGLGTLQQLSISYNRIENVENGAWEFCHQLWELDLSHNELRTVNKTVFTQLPKLERLLLDYNRISVIEDGAFSSLYSLQTLELNNNEISWNIEDTNGIFSSIHHVTKLGLAANKIRSVARKAFSGLEGLKVLDLRENAIAAVQDNAFAELKSLQDLRMNSTNLICDCHLRWLSSWMESNGFDESSSIGAKCGYPPKFQGKFVTDIAMDSMVCGDSPKPYIVEEPKTVVVLKGDNVTLTCKAKSRSSLPMRFLWKKENLVFSEGQVETTATSFDGRVTQMTSHLTLANINETDAGRYQCVVANDFVSVYSARAKLTVHVFPTFTKKPTDLRVRAGQYARLECFAEGSPPPEIRWTKAGGKDLRFPAASDRRFHLTDDYIFDIRDVKPADAGLYSCFAENVAGTIVANVTITVLETPTFIKPLEDKHVAIGETAVLECLVAGMPKPRLSWIRNGQPVIPDERHFLTAEDQLLVIVDTDIVDAGRYECEIANSLGVERASAVVTVHTGKDIYTGPLPEYTWRTNALIIIIIVCVIVATSIGWFLCIYYTRRKPSPAVPSSSLPPPSVAFPAVDFIPVNIEDHGDSRVEVYDASEEDGARPVDPEICRFYADDQSEFSEPCSSKDSGTGGSTKQTYSNDDLNTLESPYRTSTGKLSLARRQHRPRSTFVPPPKIPCTVGYPQPHQITKLTTEEVEGSGNWVGVSRELVN